jgi:hypothetical protein
MAQPLTIFAAGISKTAAAHLAMKSGGVSECPDLSPRLKTGSFENL